MTALLDKAAPLDASASGRAIIFARLTALFTTAVGIAVLFGWQLDEPLLKQGLHSGVAMKPNAAAGLILVGLGLLTLTYETSRPLSRLLGLVVLAGAAATLSQDITGWDLGIDQSIFPEPVGMPFTHSPGRTSPTTAASLALLGLVLLLTARRGWLTFIATELSLLTVLMLAIANLIGYAYGITELYYPFPFTAISIHMAVTLALTAAGCSAACPDRGFAKAVTDPSAGGHMIRRLLPGIVLIPIILGGFVHRGQLAGLYGPAVGTAFFAVSLIMVMAGFSWMTAVALRRIDLDRQQALVELEGQREWLRTTLVSIADAVIATGPDGLIDIMNPVAERLTGWTLAEASGRPISDVFRIANTTTGQPIDYAEMMKYGRTLEAERLGQRLTRKDGTACPIESVLSPILGPRGKVVGAVLIFRDITERRRAEEQQKMLVGELNHRVRNVLMIVHSLVQASAQHAQGKSAVELADALAKRLRSLSQAHELLLDTHWTGANLKAMIERELEPFRQPDTHNVILKGSDIFLPPQCTSVVAMALHELTTNAAKYGALARPGGKLQVAWRVRGAKLTLRWMESGAEVVRERRPGFGMQLIDKGIRHNLGGKTELDFRDDGLVATLEIPLGSPKRLRNAAPAGAAAQ